MTLTVKYDKQRQSTPSQVTYKKIDSVLKWDSQPKCKFAWSSWGDWSDCSKTRDGGVKVSYRSCLGTTNVNDCIRDQGGSNYKTASCETQDCCSDQSGKFKCSNGRCIQKSLLCDGNDDCGNNENESRDQCPKHIRSGDLIALRNYHGKSRWLSCGRDHQCKLSTCPGSEMSYNRDWIDCSDVMFNLHLVHLFEAT